jgi:hypothetical protein
MLALYAAAQALLANAPKAAQGHSAHTALCAARHPHTPTPDIPPHDPIHSLPHDSLPACLYLFYLSCQARPRFLPPCLHIAFLCISPFGGWAISRRAPAALYQHSLGPASPEKLDRLLFSLAFWRSGAPLSPCLFCALLIPVETPGQAKKKKKKKT